MSKLLKVQEFIDKANLIHNDKYDYNKVNYINSKTKVLIFCKKHKLYFEQTPSDHLQYHGCKKCGNENISNSKILKLQEFINKANIIHDDKYIYTKSDYIGSHTKTIITCKIHGEFEQTPNSHIYQGSGCQLCSKSITSNHEFIANYIRSKGFEVVNNYKPLFLNGQELDIFVPSLNIAIEYNGYVFHHSSNSNYVNEFHRLTYKPKEYHYNKWLLCKQNNIKLLNIFDFKFENIKDKYLIKINHLLNLDIRLYARKLKIIEICNNIDLYKSFDFHKKYHLESFNIPYKNSKSVVLYDDYYKVVMVATYGDFYEQSSGSFVLKLQRITTKHNITVIGGISKLINFIKKKEKRNDLLFHVTNDSGGTISDINFKVSLRYFWVKYENNKFTVYQRNQTQKNTLYKLFKNVDLSLTENETLEQNGFLKIYDAGISICKF